MDLEEILQKVEEIKEKLAEKYPVEYEEYKKSDAGKFGDTSFGKMLEKDVKKLGYEFGKKELEVSGQIIEQNEPKQTKPSKLPRWLTFILGLILGVTVGILLK